MKKENREKIAEFKKRESDLLFVIMQKPEQAAVNKLMLSKLRRDKEKWLREVGGYTATLPLDTSLKLEELVEKAANSMSSSSLRHAQLVAFIEEAHKSNSDMGRYYEVMVENYSQLEALSDMSSVDNVRALERFNNKINGRSFLSVLMCKFKKSKSQESESVKTENGVQK